LLLHLRHIRLPWRWRWPHRQCRVR